MREERQKETKYVSEKERGGRGDKPQNTNISREKSWPIPSKKNELDAIGTFIFFKPTNIMSLYSYFYLFDTTLNEIYFLNLSSDSKFSFVHINAIFVCIYLVVFHTTELISRFFHCGICGILRKL